MSRTQDLGLTSERLDMLDDFHYFAIATLGGTNIMPDLVGMPPNMHYGYASPDRLVTLSQILEVLIDLCGEDTKAFLWLIDNECYREIVGNDPYFCLVDGNEAASFVMLEWLQILQRFRPPELIEQMFQARSIKPVHARQRIYNAEADAARYRPLPQIESVPRKVPPSPEKSHGGGRGNGE